MQVKFLPVDAFTQFKHDNTQNIKELRQTIQKQEGEIKRLQQQMSQLLSSVKNYLIQIQQSQQSQQQQSQQQQQQQQKQQQQHTTNQNTTNQNTSTNQNTTKQTSVKQIPQNDYTQQQNTQLNTQTSHNTKQNSQQTSQKRFPFKVLDTSLLSLPTKSQLPSIQDHLNTQKQNLNVPNDCTIVYQPIGKNLQFEQKNPDTICQYSSFSKNVQICGDYIVFNTIDPVIIYLKTIDCKTLNVNVKSILVMFYKDKLEPLDKKYLGQTWYKLNNFTQDECFDNQLGMINQTNVSNHILEISISKYDPMQIDSIKDMFPNLRFIYNGFNVEYVGPEEDAD